MACTKVSFATEEFANEHIARLKEKSNRKVVPTRAYKCNKCSSYHLTSQPNWKERVSTLEAKVSGLQNKVVDLEKENGILRVGEIGKVMKRNTEHKNTLAKRNDEIKKLKKTNAELMQNLIKANTKNNA